jgi:hypothetical protein
MNTFKRKALASAVLGTLGVAGSAHAIYQDPNGLGQALVYPYYTVNSDPAGNPFNTLISVVNTTNAVKVVKVRFREGKNSAEVLDFNLYLSPNDMWTGAVVPSTTDATSPGHLVTFDVSCTNPPIPSGGVDFRNYAYSGAVNGDGLAATLDRTREGYAEMFEMGVLGAPYAAAATHGATGVPTCTGLTGANLSATVGSATAPPTGGLSGTGTIINVLSGRDTMYKANAFGAWSQLPEYSDIGNDTPNFQTTNPAASITVDPSVGKVFFASWTATTVTGITVTAGAKAAAATMMHSDVINEYILDNATKSDTDWVLTFPTKRLFVNQVVAVSPFTNVLTASGACETIGVAYFNREEASATASGVDFSPTPPGAAANSLCWESTILSVRNGSTNAPSSPATPSLVLGSANVTALSVSSSFQNGWMQLHFAGTNATTTGLAADATSSTVTGPPVVTSAGAVTYLGLPVVGFMVRTFTNGALACGTATCQGNYLGSAGHSYLTSP